MSTLGSGGPSPAAAAAVEDTSRHWVPHGAVLTACVVGVNVLVIALIFFLFWRFLFGKEELEPSTSAAAAATDADEDDDDSPPVASPWASRWRRHHEDLGAPPLEDVASALPVYIYSSAGAADEEGGKQHADECAVCIVDLRDGEPARRVPRCGHQFHADCVATWLRLHATCPLCRASVVAAAPGPAAAGAAVADESTRSAKEEDDEVAADCPV
ncbi:unnamed protein product [Urochloa decumbens]|uniref:RING-type E3 ubiquitin transferase n=1 Tax=Urochloa decumbens TaxID=240449 RepID=A0ABC9GG32_9POAL